MTASLPLPISQAIASLANYLSSHAVKYGRSGPRHRGMRSDRRKNILAIATSMLHGASLQHNGLVCLITRFWARPMSIAEMAHMAGICPRTASNCLADMQDLGLIECSQIKRRNKETGLLEVSIGIRRFTKKFWQALGLWELYQQSVKWAKEKARRKLLMPFKSVSCKAKQAAKKAGNVVKTAIGNLPIVKSGSLQKQVPVAENPASNSGTSTVQLRLQWIKDRLTGGEYMDFEQWLVKNKRE